MSVILFHIRQALLQIVYAATYCIEQGSGSPWHIRFLGELWDLLDRFDLVDDLIGVLRVELNQGEGGFTGLLFLFAEKRV